MARLKKPRCGVPVPKSWKSHGYDMTKWDPWPACKLPPGHDGYHRAETDEGELGWWTYPGESGSETNVEVR